MAKNDIIQELNELESKLAAYQPVLPYAVPAGYFDGLAAAVWQRIKADEAADASAELEILSPLLAGISRQIPYQVPAGYFEGLSVSAEAAMMEDMTAADELTSLSPVLAGAQKTSPYTVPDGYFDQVKTPASAPVVKMGSSRSWKRYAAAASVIILLGISSLLFFNRNKSIDPATDSYAWMEKNMKKVSEQEIDAMVKLAEAVSPTLASNGNGGSDIRDLMKNVSDSEIDHFLQDVETVMDNGDNDPLLN